MKATLEYNLPDEQAEFEKADTLQTFAIRRIWRLK